MSTDNKTKEELALSLLTAYEEADTKVQNIKDSLDKANRDRSDAVKQIHQHLGSGPFYFKNKYLGKIVIRGETYFFRGKNEEGTIKVG